MRGIKRLGDTYECVLTGKGVCSAGHPYMHVCTMHMSSHRRSAVCNHHIYASKVGTAFVARTLSCLDALCAFGLPSCMGAYSAACFITWCGVARFSRSPFCACLCVCGKPVGAVCVCIYMGLPLFVIASDLVAAILSSA